MVNIQFLIIEKISFKHSVHSAEFTLNKSFVCVPTRTKYNNRNKPIIAVVVTVMMMMMGMMMIIIMCSRFTVHVYCTGLKIY